MREILFRGKSIDNNSWEYGYYFISEGRHYIQWALKNDQMTWCQVHPETVSQFTGLLDKSGKKIFEGDVVKLDGVRSWEIRFVGRGFIGVPPEDQVFQQVLENNNYLQFEVSGNIHDSPNNLPPH